MVPPSEKLTRAQHEAVKIGREFRVRVEREHMADILVGSHNDDAALGTVDAAHIENVVAAFHIGQKIFS